MKSLTVRVGIPLVVACLAVPSLASASAIQLITIIDTSEGSPTETCTICTTSTFSIEGVDNSGSFSYPNTFPGPGVLTEGFNIYDPDGTTLSDTWFFAFVDVSSTSATFNSQFRSDIEGQPLTALSLGTGDFNFLHSVQETSSLVDVTGLISADLGTLGQPTSTVDFAFQSDIDAVPEPATLLLVGCGLAVAARRRKLRASA